MCLYEIREYSQTIKKIVKVNSHEKLQMSRLFHELIILENRATETQEN